MTQTRIIEPEDVELELVQDAERYIDKVVDLVLHDCDAGPLRIRLDGVKLGDIIADAREIGIPLTKRSRGKTGPTGR